jgi:tetratricopeptide (TPR) repeat protein
MSAPSLLLVKFFNPVNMGTSADPVADTRRADELISQALALDPTAAWGHNDNAWNLFNQGRVEEAIAERERALALDPADVGTPQGLAWDHVSLGQYEKGLELFDQAIRLSPRDPSLQFIYFGKSWMNFGRQPAGAGAMLVACRLAGLSALEAQAR